MLVIAIDCVQHSLVGGLHCMCVICRERVLGRQSPVCPKSKIVTIFELVDLCKQATICPAKFRMAARKGPGCPILKNEVAERSTGALSSLAALALREVGPHPAPTGVAQTLTGGA